MADEIKNGLIGLFVIAGLAVLVFIILFLHPQAGDEGQTLYVRFSDIDKISVGTRVNFAGRPVGEVVEIREVPAPREEHFRDKWIYPYELVLKIDSSVKVYNSDEISARTSGLLGERSVAITPRHPEDGIKLVLVTGDDILFATEGTSVDEAFDTFNKLSTKAEEVLDNILDQLNDMKHQKLWENIGKTAHNMAGITTDLNQPDFWKNTMADVKTFTASANTSADNISEFTRRLNTAEGTVNRLINNDDLYLRATAVMSKADIIMDDINHYGILYHNDKGWQRLRARRMNLMQKLQCPQEFRNFFNDEINSISTSLCRVATVLDQTFCMIPPEELLGDCGFEALFADLLRRVSGLEENIRMYNQQLVTEYNRGYCLD